MARAMRKRIFLPLFTILIFFPFLVFLFSYTRFFNDEVESLLTKVVDEQTNTQLYMGKIHGSILGSFRIDGAALMYHGAPIMLIDTIKISHLPLSIITKTVEVLQCELVNPRFYLVRFKDGTLNVDHIGKGQPKKGGKFDWFVILKNLKIRGGEFSLIDSTQASSLNLSDTLRRFNSSDFRLKEIDLSASGNISEDNLSASFKNISLDIDPIGVKINSLKFDFFTSAVGAEISGLDLNSELAKLNGDFTLTGQNLLDPIDLPRFRSKQMTASFNIKDADISQVKKFINIPIDPVSKVDLNCFASGNLDTLYVKQLSVRTDSSYVPLTATLYNLPDSRMTMRVETRGSSVNPAELSSMLANAGAPDLRQFKPFLLNALAEGKPSELRFTMGLKTGETEISADANSHDGWYDGRLEFHNLNLGELLNTRNLTTSLAGNASFNLKGTTGHLPEGTISVMIDSSTIQQATVQNGRVNVSAVSDSLNTDLHFLTSKGNISGTATFDTRSKSYSSDLSFSEFDLSAFAGSPSLSGISTGRLSISGSGFDIDSLDNKLLLFLDYSTLGGVPISNAAFTFVADTRDADKNLKLNSPVVDASVSGNFVADKLPSQLSKLFSALADSFTSRVTGKQGLGHSDSFDISGINASLSANIKDARFIGKILGVPELRGNLQTQFNILSSVSGISLNGSVEADSIGYSKDSLQISGSQISVRYNLITDNKASLWGSGRWSIDANFHGLDINQTHLASKILRVGYSGDDSLSITALCQIDSLAEFYIDASGIAREDSIDLTANTLMGKFYGVSLTSVDVVHIGYSPEVFTISPTTFLARLDGTSAGSDSRISVRGQYSLGKGTDLQFKFNNVELASLQKIGRLDTSSFRLIGKVDGDASLTESSSGTNITISFAGKDIDYNGAKSKLIGGNVKIYDNYLELSSQLSKSTDSSRYALRIDGTVPFSDTSSKSMQLKIVTDSLDISFLTPFLTGVGDLEGNVSGNMTVSGKYSLPEFNGQLNVSDGKIVQLAANQITYPFAGAIYGQGDKLVLNPVSIKNSIGKTNTTMMARGSLEIRNNTITSFDIDLDGTLLVLNSALGKSDQGVYGIAIVGSGEQGLKLKGSLARPFLEGSGIIQSTTLTLMPIQSKQAAQVQEVIYHFPTDTASKISVKPSQIAEEPRSEVESGSFIDSLRYDVNVDTKDNVNFRMIFDPTTNEELDAVLGGKLHLSNLSGSMELIGDVNIMTGSTYNFYGKQFNATGKIRFTGDPLNPVLDITGIYQGQHQDTSSTGKPQNIVVQLRITGTFNLPIVDISMTRDNAPYPNDQQTNAISFILTGQFADELSSAQKQSVANNLWSQTGAGVLGSVGSSVLSGYLTNLLGKQLGFVQSFGLQYNSVSGITDPNVQVTTKFWDGTLKVQTPIVYDIASTGFSLMYPIWGSLMAEASRNVTQNNRTLGAREATDMLRLFYQLSF